MNSIMWWSCDMSCDLLQPSFWSSLFAAVNTEYRHVLLWQLVHTTIATQVHLPPLPGAVLAPASNWGHVTLVAAFREKGQMKLTLQQPTIKNNKCLTFSACHVTFASASLGQQNPLVPGRSDRMMSHDLPIELHNITWLALHNVTWLESHYLL